MSEIDNLRRRVAVSAAAIVLTLLPAHAAQSPGRSAPVHGAVVVSGRDLVPPPPSREQLEDVDARIAAATALVDRFGRDAKARGLASSWRQATLERLLPLSLEGLHRVAQQAPSLDALAAAAMEAADDPSYVGNRASDLVYTPIAPCRFIDTRNAGGKIVGVRAFDVDKPGSSYGGAGACDPVSLLNIATRNSAFIAALAMNVTLVDTSTAGAPGVVAIKPTAAAPTSSLLNWSQQGPDVQVANQGVVSLDSNSLGQDEEFVIQTSGAVHIIVDLFGAFILPQATPLDTVHLFSSIVVPHHAATGIESPRVQRGTA